MSCAYFTEIGYKFKDADSEAKAVKELADFLRKGVLRGGREFEAGVEKFASYGTKCDNFVNCLKVLFACWPKGENGVPGQDGIGDGPTDDGNGFLVCGNSFNCSYGWLFVMEEGLDRIAQYLADDSWWNLDFDNDFCDYEVHDGVANVVSEGQRQDEDDEDGEEEGL